MLACLCATSSFAGTAGKFEGWELDDATLQPLAGQPTLRKVHLINCRVTTACASIFATMPNLKELKIDVWKPSPHRLLSWNDVPALKAALPHVYIDFCEHDSMPPVTAPTAPGATTTSLTLPLPSWNRERGR